MVALRWWFKKLKTHPVINIYTSTYTTISIKSSNLSKKTSPSNLKSSTDLCKQIFYKHMGSHRPMLTKSRLNDLLVFLGPKPLSPSLNFYYLFATSLNLMLSRLLTKPHLCFRRSLKNHLVPIFDMLKSVTGSHRGAAAAVISNPFVLTYSISRDLLPNIELLQKLGVPEYQVLKFVTEYGQITGKQHDKFSEVVKKVRDMGFNLSSYGFRRAVTCLCLISDEIWEAKCKIYRSFGFSDDEIVSMFKKLPAVVVYSDNRISKVLEFYVKKLGWTPSRLEVLPYVIAFSLEKRIIPRCSVLQASESRKSVSSSSGLQALELRTFLSSTSGFYKILWMTDISFLEKYVTAYMDEVPEVMDAYTGKLRFDEYTFRCKD